MPTYALVRNGAFIETREQAESEIPVHKLDIDGGCILRPFIDTPAPAINAALEWQTSELVVEPDNVTRVWSSGRLPLLRQQQAVKDECGRRIYAAFPQWKQANYTARATELVLAKTNGELTQAETDELAALQASWSWIKAVRAASDILEASDPIPLDYTDDIHWPAPWED
jgi:hypothetical protein